MIEYLEWFSYIDPLLHCRDEAILILVDDDMDVFLVLVCNCLVEYFSINVKEAWSEVLSLFGFTWSYRLAPQYPFPAALEDCVLVIKYFLQDTILKKYGVDPTRICISGDSCGGTLATTAIQLVCCVAEDVWLFGPSAVTLRPPLLLC